jgi:hypothetical protein
MPSPRAHDLPYRLTVLFVFRDSRAQSFQLSEQQRNPSRRVGGVGPGLQDLNIGWADRIACCVQHWDITSVQKLREQALRSWIARGVQGQPLRETPSVDEAVIEPGADLSTRDAPPADATDWVSLRILVVEEVSHTSTESIRRASWPHMGDECARSGSGVRVSGPPLDSFHLPSTVARSAALSPAHAPPTPGTIQLREALAPLNPPRPACC